MQNRIVHIDMQPQQPKVLITRRNGQHLYKPTPSSFFRVLSVCKGNPKIYKRKFLPLTRYVAYFDA